MNKKLLGKIRKMLVVIHLYEKVWDTNQERSIRQKNRVPMDIRGNKWKGEIVEKRDGHGERHGHLAALEHGHIIIDRLIWRGTCKAYQICQG